MRVIFRRQLLNIAIDTFIFDQTNNLNGLRRDRPVISDGVFAVGTIIGELWHSTPFPKPSWLHITAFQAANIAEVIPYNGFGCWALRVRAEDANVSPCIFLNNNRNRSRLIVANYILLCQLNNYRKVIIWRYVAICL